VIAVLKVYSQAGDSLVIKYNYINSVPQDADLYLNDEQIGKTPMHFMWDTSYEKNVIKIKMKGYSDIVYIPSNEEKYVNKTFKLVPLSGNVSEEIVFKNKSSSFQNPLKLTPIIISSVVTAGSAILAYYFKSEAIEYTVLGDIDKKKHYDLLGGISLIVFQVGLCTLIYFFFIDN
jgi:PEGA domain